MISYARDDRDRLPPVIAALEEAGYDVWWDDALTPRAPWDTEIETVIAEAEAVLALWTPQSVTREWVRLEAGAAKDQGKLVPAFLAPCRAPLPFRLVQTADLTGWDGTPDDPMWQKVLGWIASAGHPEPLGGAADEVSDQFAPSIRARFARINRIVDRLTADQFDILRILHTTRRVRISGCAGSGKTLVACEKAMRCAAAGLRVLFLCHSPHLAARVAELTGDSPVQVADFSNWLLRGLGLGATDPGTKWINVDEPDETTLEQAFDVMFETQNFDAVIVDEGQDFRDTWWLLIEAALASQRDSQLYIFHDDNQALLPYRASYPFDDPVLNLSKNCRNAGRVFEAVRRFHSHAPAPEAALGGHGFLAYFRADPPDLDQAVNRAAHALAAHGALHEDRVVLLSGGLEKTPLVQTCLTLTGDMDDSWSSVVRSHMTKAITTYVRRGIVTAQDVALEEIARLSALSDAPSPTPDDIALVTEVARSITVDDQIVQKIGGGSKNNLDLAWSLANGKLRFKRKLGGRLHGVEILRFFSDPSWAEGQPEDTRWRFMTSDMSSKPGDTPHIPVYDVATFKGLEADTALVIIGHHEPVSTEKLYVATSRARQTLAIVDCSGGLTHFDALRKVDFDLRLIGQDPL